ncbi:MAG TPA: carboxypeptidase-like regulatory domain-containing protein, partial [Thermoanaerobaculia bacterium]|nr:carboxypeptidase-like regulatory domain-containing protein [Thermoanaerobaculia bacterium]
MRARTVSVVLWAVLSIAGPAVAQQTTGSIGGRITDPSNTPLPGVTVTATSPALIGSRSSVTDENGEYMIRRLPPGAYEVRTELSGFAPMLRQGIEVRVGQAAWVHFRMALAAVTETTVVRADPPIIDTRNTSRNYTIDARAVELIPLSTSQQYTDLWVAAPGVRDSIASFSSTVRQPSINGAAVSQNKVYVDGIDATDHVNAGTSTFLNQSIIQEVAISTGAFEAAAGFGSGGLMHIVTRSGGNEFKGGASIVLTPKRFNDTN